MSSKIPKEKGLVALQAHWKHLYQDVLPTASKLKDPVQKSWPVVNDHCFARIVLDNAVGKDKPWHEVLDAPAYKNMTREQLESAVDLAERIATGEVEIGLLNERSLKMRGKTSVKRKAAIEPTSGNNIADAKKQKKANTGTISEYFLPSPSSLHNVGAKAKPLLQPEETEKDDNDKNGLKHEEDDNNISVQLALIANSSLSEFRKTALGLLCQIPPGRWSTYKAISDHISATSHKTCARAVGSAMRNNPFAPGVPCHRILAADRTLGGFCGHWGENGRFANKKHELLHLERVRFDSGGKAKGVPFTEFKS
ncbi:Hypothetical protein R9X50_00492900 [Acrodontium crateriforme]|uniref:Methylated-DNA--protein-cysteine methyltransferase n=1 Tax=Acrodontium crateriforme TaxID=150365 RepID=A0AAQ3M5H6_9PEZI|nr:Hypothetical protein R9X50_00492900 [Acrodontium crateriforme]